MIPAITKIALTFRLPFLNVFEKVLTPNQLPTRSFTRVVFIVSFGFALTNSLALATMRIATSFLTTAVVFSTTAAVKSELELENTPAPYQSAFQAAGPPPAPSPTLFDFAPQFGNWMVLQQEPAMAAVYGTLSDGGTAVEVCWML